MANSRKVKFALSVGIFLLLVVGGNVACWATPTDDSAQCLDAAKNALGSEAEVLKCGHLTAADALETIAVMRLKQLKETKEGIPVSRLVVLRRTKSQWITELAVDRNSRKN
ncbi:MAG TPA: hypothetical protein VG892_02980, partial [Terriglobales bacterium]|nr:hypothetical protein [Terriglobales bacterium]